MDLRRVAHDLVAFAVLDALCLLFLVGVLGGFVAVLRPGHLASLLDVAVLKQLALASSLAAFAGMVRARDPAAPPPRGRLMRKLLRVPAAKPARATPLSVAVMLPGKP